MKLKANDYEAKEIIKILREWTELTQKEFGKSIYMSGGAIQGYERGIRRFPVDVLLKIAKKHNLTITIESKKK